MKKMNWCYQHISNKLPPPPHTKIKPRCFTCRKWPVCNIRQDYLKTLKLMEDVLGSPSENYELIQLPGFTGRAFLYGNFVMPETVNLSFKNEEKESKFVALKTRDIDNYSFVYDADGYKIIFDATYNQGESAFASEFNQEDLFNCFDLSNFTYEARTDYVSGWEYHYLPIGFEISETDLREIKEDINNIESGNFSLKIPFTVAGVFGNYNGEERYPTDLEITADSSLILSGLTSGRILLPLTKENGIIKIQEGKNIQIVISPTTDTAMWNNIFNAQTLNFDESTTENVFNLLNKEIAMGDFTISQGRDAFYDFKINMTAEDKIKVNEALLLIREKLIEEEEKEVINTTSFHAHLECAFYDWEKGLTEEEGLKRILLQYPNGIPLGDNKELYHIQTFHLEDKKMCCYHPSKPAFMPHPLPPKVKPKAFTREELNEF